MKNLRITLKKSLISEKAPHRAACAALGLRRINQRVTKQDTPAIRGIVNQVAYLLHVEELA